MQHTDGMPRHGTGELNDAHHLISINGHAAHVQTICMYLPDFVGSQQRSTRVWPSLSKLSLLESNILTLPPKCRQRGG